MTAEKAVLSVGSSVTGSAGRPTTSVPPYRDPTWVPDDAGPSAPSASIVTRATTKRVPLIERLLERSGGRSTLRPGQAADKACSDVWPGEHRVAQHVLR